MSRCGLLLLPTAMGEGTNHWLFHCSLELVAADVIKLDRSQRQDLDLGGNLLPLRNNYHQLMHFM